jgi:hypothetical protein
MREKITDDLSTVGRFAIMTTTIRPRKGKFLKPGERVFITHTSRGWFTIERADGTFVNGLRRSEFELDRDQRPKKTEQKEHGKQ